MTEKISPSSSLNYKPTPRQIRTITNQAQALGITAPIESTVKTRAEARNLIFKQRHQLRKRGKQ